MQKTWMTFAAPLLFLTPTLGSAVENGDSMALWFETDNANYGFIEQLNSIDFDPNTPGLEALGANDSASAEIDGDNARMVWRQRFQFRNATTAALLGQFTITTKSEPYPVDDDIYDYECEDYNGELNPDGTIEDCDPNLSVGIAETSTGGRFLVLSTGVLIDYFGASEGVADIYKLHVFDLDDNSLAWAKSFPLEVSAGSGDPWELDLSLSGVADYLGDDGTDEVRIAQDRVVGGGNLRFRYRYYNIETGALIDTVSFSTSEP